ncbi:hypothetical protein ACWEN6_27650 [Sphaerisporangium sp. NPDC004334]
MGEAETRRRSRTAAPPSGTGRTAVRMTSVLAGFGFVADAAAVAQLITSGPRQGILVAGVLAVVAGLLGLIPLFGRPIGFRAIFMIALTVSGAGVTGAMIEKYLDEPPASVAAPSASGTPDAAARGPGPTPDTTPSTSAAPPTATPSPRPGDVLRQGEATLKDQDYLDAETGRIGEVQPRASDVWYVGPYRSLWTAGGGALPITPVEGRPDGAACADALATHDYDLVEVGTMKAGDWACARTAEGNLLAIRITAVPVGDAPLKISYVVWHK